MRQRDEWARWADDNPHRITSTATYDKQGAGNEPLAEEETPRFDGPVDILIESHVKRIRDPDGNFCKYIIDAIVDRGILADDTPEEIREIRHRQVKSKEEKTVIIMSGVNDHKK